MLLIAIARTLPLEFLCEPGALHLVTSPRRGGRRDSSGWGADETLS